MVQVSSEYISIGCNRTAHAACWGHNGLVAFGADTLIALYSPLVKLKFKMRRGTKLLTLNNLFIRMRIVKVFKKHFLDIKVVLFV
jgi:hypothetical protein